MKKLALIFCFFAITSAFAQSSKLANLMLELETAVKWEAVEKKWQTRRNAWIKEVKAATTAEQFGKLLGEFETNVTWAAVDQAKWEPRREKWGSEVMGAKTFGNVAKLMVEFESYTKWEGVQEAWKKRRDSWVKDASAVK